MLVHFPIFKDGCIDVLEFLHIPKEKFKGAFNNILFRLPRQEDVMGGLQYVPVMKCTLCGNYCLNDNTSQDVAVRQLKQRLNEAKWDCKCIQPCTAFDCGR